MRPKKRSSCFFLIIFPMLWSCASGVLQYEEMEKLEINKEYDNMITVKNLAAPPTQDLIQAALPEKPVDQTSKEAKGTGKKISSPSKEKKDTPSKSKETISGKDKDKYKDKISMSKKDEKKKVRIEEHSMEEPTEKSISGERANKIASGQRQPELEDSEGFLGRRPIKDPFGVGEKIVLSVTYFRLKAGELTLESQPYVEVNGKKSYHFVISIKSFSFFDRIYAVDDWAETFFDFEKLIPYNLAVHIRESKQIKESRSVYDFEKGEANFWEKRVTKEDGEKNKKISWAIDPYSQNVLSAIFYLRTFTLSQGKMLHFKIADAGKNILFRAEIVREESISHRGNDLECFVLKLEFKQDGVFQKTGDVFLWLTKDDRKFPVRIESKIKIGSLVGSLQSLQPGVQ